MVSINQSYIIPNYLNWVWQNFSLHSKLSTLVVCSKPRLTVSFGQETNNSYFCFYLSFCKPARFLKPGRFCVRKNYVFISNTEALNSKRINIQYFLSESILREEFEKEFKKNYIIEESLILWHKFSKVIHLITFTIIFA